MRGKKTCEWSAQPLPPIGRRPGAPDTAMAIRLIFTLGLAALGVLAATHRPGNLWQGADKAVVAAL